MNKEQALRELGFNSDFIRAFNEYNDRIAPLEVTNPVSQPVSYTSSDSTSFVLKSGPSPFNESIRVEDRD